MINPLEILLFCAVIGLVVYGGYIAIEETEKEIEMYCNNSSNTTFRGELEFNCSDLFISEVKE